MPRSVLFPEWQEQNRHRKYPFSDSATLTNGSETISETFLLDARFYPVGGGARQYLSRISIDGDLVTFIVSDSTGERCRASFNPIDPPTVLEFFDSFGRAAGVMVAEPESASLITGLGIGDFDFRVEQTEFSSIVVSPIPPAGVRGISIPSGDFFAGDVWLVGGQGVVFSEEAGAIRMDVVGDPYAVRTSCQDSAVGEYEPPRFVSTINGMAPSAIGNFTLVPGTDQALDSVLRVEASGTGGLIIYAVGER